MVAGRELNLEEVNLPLREQESVIFYCKIRGFSILEANMVKLSREMLHTAVNQGAMRKGQHIHVHLQIYQTIFLFVKLPQIQALVKVNFKPFSSLILIAIKVKVTLLGCNSYL